MNRRRHVASIGRFFPILVTGVFVLLAGCTIFNLNAPTWDMHFTVPLINKTYTMNKFVEDEDNLVISDDGKVAYTLSGDIDTFKVGNHLKSDALESHLFFYVDENFTSLTRRGAAQLSDEYHITEAVIMKGDLYIETRNPTRYAVDSWFNFQDFRNFNIPNITISPGEDQMHGPYPLDGAIVSTNPQDRQSIRYEVTTQKTGEEPNGASSGNIEVIVRIENVVFEQVTGILDQVEVPMDTIQTDLNLPEQLEGIQFGLLTLQLTIQNGADVDAQADIRFEAVDKDGQIATLTAGGTVEGNATSTLDVDGFETLINQFPKQLYFYGSLLLGDGQTVSTVHYDDVIQGSYFSEIPLVFKLADYVNETEPDTIELSQDSQDAFRDNLLEAHLMIEAFNHLPLGATVEIIFSKNFESVYTQNADVVKTLRLNPGETQQGQEGTMENPLPVIGTGESILDFGLTKDELQVFEHDQVFYGTRISFDATLGFVQVSPEDYITLRSWVDVTINTKIPEEDEEEGGE